MHSFRQMTKFFGRLYSRIGYSDSSSVYQNFPRLSVAVRTGLVGGTGLSVAKAQEGQERGPRDQTDGPTRATKDWISNRVKGDICHLAPGISELMLDILDLMQDNYDRYIMVMKRRVSDLESNLRKYGSAVSLNLADADNFALTDPGSKEIQQIRKDYRKTYQRSSEMLVGLDRFLLSAVQLGANTCVEKCQIQLREITGLLDDLDHKIRDYENRLEMAEKHFRTKMRRAGNIR